LQTFDVPELKFGGKALFRESSDLSWAPWNSRESEDSSSSIREHSHSLGLWEQMPLCAWRGAGEVVGSRSEQQASIEQAERALNGAPCLSFGHWAARGVTQLEQISCRDCIVSKWHKRRLDYLACQNWRWRSIYIYFTFISHISHF